MSQYNDIYFKRRDTNVVVAYCAPNFKVLPVYTDDVKHYKMQRGRAQKYNDRLLFILEVTIQGTFEDSTNLPDDHKTALEALFGTSPVTARMQVNRILDAAMNNQQGYQLWVGSDAYAFDNEGDLDYPIGKFPTAWLKEFRPTKPSGLTRVEYLLRFLIGLPT